MGDRSQPHVWGFRLEVLGPSTTEVTEVFDCARAPEWLQLATRGGQVWIESMQASLSKLDDLVAARLLPIA